MSNGLHLCKKCGQEKDRHPRQNRGYRYTCGCAEWKLMLAALGHARRKEEKRRVRPKP